MDAERWRQIETIYHSALRRPPGEREQYLAEACSGDEALRDEVQALILQHEKSGSFIDTPVFDLGVKALAEQAALPTGRTVGHYVILEIIGRGGMGEVYLARDPRLGRKVALKLLPEALKGNSDRVQRFRQEARAASAVSHPNIAHVYDVGEAEGRFYTAIEYVDGVTLRQLITEGRLAMREAVEIAVQVAEALAAAHARGVVHRDVKPENVMIHRDGYVKVLDFGLAKLVEQLRTNDFGGAEAPTAPLVHSEPGVMMGTVKYMSPEQARGKEVDARTDLWSLGVVLYEMLTGRAPFEGETMSDVIVQVLEHEPRALTGGARPLPAKLDEVVVKALRKEAAERYQTAQEFAADLKRVSRRLELDAEVERSSPPNSGPILSRVVAGGGPLNETATNSAATRTAGVGAARTTSSAEYLVTGVRRHKWGVAVICALLAVTLAGIGYGIYKLAGQKHAGLSFQTAKFARLTSTGKAIGAAISPDGKWLVHVQDDGGQRSLWLRQVAVPNSNTQIVPPADVIYWGLAFSPDGNYIYYSAGEKIGSPGSLYQTPVLGGTTRKLATDVNSSVAFSPDGKQIAYLFFNFHGDEDRLMIANADGTGVRELAVRRGDDYFYLGAFSSVSWSPDGRTIATPVGNNVESYMSVAEVSVASGEVKLLTPHRWEEVLQVAGLGDGSQLLVTAKEQGAETFNIWQLSYLTGEAQKLTNDLNSYPFFSLTADARLLAAVRTERTSNIWLLPAFDAAQAKPITQGLNFVDRPSWTPDGRIVYSSNASGNYDLYAIDARGGEPKQLTTSPGSDRYAFVSPDGRYVVFASDRAGQLNIWRMDIDGANAKQVTDKIGYEPTLSPDGRWLVYGWCLPKCMIWKVELDGGQPQLITEKTAAHVTISPDGMQIACLYQPEPNAPLRPAILSFADGQPVKTFAPPAGLSRYLRWTADGNALVYTLTVGGVSNLWAQPVDGGPPKQLTNFTAEHIFAFDISRDGRQLALSRGTQSSDVVLIRDFK